MNNTIAWKKSTYILFSLVLLFTSCTVSWLPKYDAELEAQIVNTAKQNDKLYFEMTDAVVSDRTYANFASRYNDLLVEINSIKLKIQGQNNNKDFLVLINTVQEQFTKYKTEHQKKDTGTLSNGEIQIYNLQMQAAWKALYLAERGIKEK